MRMRTGSDDEDDSEDEDEEKDEEEEVSAAEDSMAKQKSGATRGKWLRAAEPVEKLRAEDRNALQKRNSAAYKAVVGNRRPPRRTTW